MVLDGNAINGYFPWHVCINYSEITSLGLKIEICLGYLKLYNKIFINPKIYLIC